jgi:hypothetical protein
MYLRAARKWSNYGFFILWVWVVVLRSIHHRLFFNHERQRDRERERAAPIDALARREACFFGFFFELPPRDEAAVGLEQARDSEHEQSHGRRFGDRRRVRRHRLGRGKTARKEKAQPSF